MRIVLVQLKSGDFLRIYEGDTTSGNLLFDETDGHETSINSTRYVNNESFGKIHSPNCTYKSLGF